MFLWLATPFLPGVAIFSKPLGAALTGDGTAVLTQPQSLSGLGGVGKTQLAAEYAHTHADQYKAIFWLRAATVSDLQSGFVGIARALHLAEAQSEPSIVQKAVLRWLEASEGWLLIFDNADVPEIVRPFVPSRLRGHLLFTSRRRTLQELGVVQPLEVEVLSQDDALAFLMRRTGRLGAAEDERNAALLLAQELDGLPLALEQAAAYIVEASAQFADYLEPISIGV